MSFAQLLLCILPALASAGPAAKNAAPLTRAVKLPNASALPAPFLAPLPPALPDLAAQQAAAQPVIRTAANSAGAPAARPAALEQAAAAGLPSAPSVPAATENEAASASRVFDKPLNIVMAASESVPFVKTGGLADVVDAVTRGLSARGHDVTLFLPKYAQLKVDMSRFKRQFVHVPVRIDNRVEHATLWVGDHEGVKVVLVEHEGFFEREGFYGDHAGGSYSDHADNDERFGFFSHAVLAATTALGLHPDVIHVHDWQTALIPAILKLQGDVNPALAAVKTVLTLHNLAFQGLFPAWSALKTGFSSQHFNPEQLEYYGQFNFLKAGALSADALTTVSPNYAREIQEGNEFGMGLEGVLRRRSNELYGILNGLDLKLWDPASDGAIPFNYDARTAARGKVSNKKELQRMAGLPIGADIPLLGLASRLSDQKGIDLVATVIPEIVRMGAQIVITGSGDKDLMRWLKDLAKRYPKNVFINASFSEEWARLIYAASDSLLMPSRFEPCGLSQLMAQRYGSLPIVSKTGGLADTVTDIRHDPDGDGLFIDELSPRGLTDAVAAALKIHADPELRERARRNAMLKNTSWDRAIDEYLALYKSLLEP